MTKTFKELKEISQGLADLVGVSYDVAASVVASFLPWVSGIKWTR